MELNRPAGMPLSSSRSTGWQAVLAVVALLLGISAAACTTSEPTSSPTATPKPVDPREELQRTVQRLMDLQSVTFDLDHEVGSTSILPGVLMHRAYGKAIVPDEFDVTVEGELLFPRSYIEIGMISVDGSSYMTNLINGEWGQVPPEALPMDLSTLGVTLANIVDNVQEPELVARDQLEGIAVYHITGNITSEVLKQLVPTAGSGFPVALEMWTEQHSGMLRQALITGKVVLTDVEDYQRKLTLDNVDKPVTVEPPEL